MKKIYYLFIFIFSFSVLTAQEKLSKEEKARREKNIQAGNPFAQFGYKAKIATLSKGKYLEFHDLDSIVTIGTVRWHVLKNEIVGRIVQDSLNPDAQPIGDRVGRWISPDPLSEEFPSWSPYNMCMDNPMRMVDPDGRAPVDWIKNLKTGGFEWRNEVTSASNTPKGYSYVGKENSSIVDNLFSTSSARNSDWDAGLIAAEDFDNPYSAKGAGFYNMTAKTELSVSISADVTTKFDSSGNVASKKFEGVTISASIAGNANAPYPGVDISLTGNSMTLQGNQMGAFKPSPSGDILPGGNVPTLSFQNSWGAKSIQSNFGKSFDLNFKFQGQYTNGGIPMSAPGPAGLIGLPNTTDLSTSIKFENKTP